MFKPYGRLVGRIRAVRGLHEGGRNCIKYFKKGWNRKEGKRNKDLKKGRGKLGQEVSAFFVLEIFKFLSLLFGHV